MSINLQEIINKLQTAKSELQQQGRFRQYAEGLDAIITHTSEPLMLMVMGSFSTGKSSFINALVGEEIAAVEAKPTTAVVTKLCYGTQDKLLLHFRDGSVKTATPKEFNRMTAVNDEEQLNAIHEKLDYVERQMPIDILKQISIIDSPGLNDVAEKHSEATERFVNKADTVLWMFSTVQLGTRAEMAAMDKLTPRLKPIAIVNKMDLIDEEEDDPQEILANAKKMLQDRVQAVVGISAKYELEGKKENNALKRELGNFAELEKAVADLVLPHREKFKLNTLLDELGSYFDAINSDFTEAKQENEENKSGNYALYMQNEEKFMQVEDILNSVVRGILDYCEREAGQNNEQALFLLGVLYQSGIGVLQDTEKALKFYQKAAMKNHQDAMINLYVYYRDHSADETAAYWLKKLAEQGVAGAQNAYADALCKDKKLEEAVQWYEKAAKQGFAPAQTHLVQHYIYGAGVDTDYEVAKQWCEKAVAQDYYVAQYFMAEYFIRDRKEQYKLYRKAAEQGYDEAQNAVGRFLEEGWGGVAKNEAEAIEWFRKAAEQGFSVAQYNLAVCLENGDGCREDKAEAVEWYRKAAEQGHPEAQNNLGYCLEHGIGYDENKAEAFKWYKKSAEQNIADAQNMTGRFLEEGWGGIEKSEEEAVEWYRRAANNNHSAAQYNLANCLFVGRGCDVDQAEAVEWYRKSAEQGIAVAQKEYGNCLFYGKGCNQNKEEAVKWYRKASEQGFVLAQRNLAVCLENGEGCTQNLYEAKKWYEKAAEQGNEFAVKAVKRLTDNSQSMENAALITQNENSNKDLANQLRKAAEAGDAEAQYELGTRLYYGNECKVNNEEAVKWFRKAAEQGHTKAQYLLGQSFVLGMGCKKNKEEAEKWLRKAAEKGYTKANAYLCYLLMEQAPQDKNSNNYLIYQLRKLAETGDVESQYELGTRLYYGNECKVNNEEAVKWFRKAAEQGHTKAQYLLGQSFVLGMGCKKNKEEAEKWLRKAAEKGHIKAQEYLNSLSMEKTEIVSRKSRKVATQSSGCLLPILVTLAVVIAIATL